MSEDFSLREKILRDVIEDLESVFNGRNLKITEVLSLLGGKVGEILLQGRLSGMHWMSFMGSLIQTIMRNLDDPEIRLHIFKEEADGEPEQEKADHRPRKRGKRRSKSGGNDSGSANENGSEA